MNIRVFRKSTHRVKHYFFFYFFYFFFFFFWRIAL